MAICATAIAIVLVADVAAVLVVANRNRVHTPAALKGVLPELRDFVERTRGLSFKEGVDVFLLDDDEFDAALLRLGAAATDPLRYYEESRFLVGFLKALGLVGRDFQLSSVEAAGIETLLGLYDPNEKEIIVRRRLEGPLLRRVLAHELTHALDDQHFPLQETRVDLRTEQARALQALVEGDAGYVDELYRAQLPPEAQNAADGAVEGLDAVPATAGPFLALLAFPYASGPGFVQALVERGGSSAVDAAFRSPPATSEEILHPELFLEQRSSVVPVRRPTPKGPLLGLGVLGELGLRLVLGETLDAPAAAAAAAGWGGDQYVAWSENERVCVQVDLAMDSAQDVKEVRDGLRRWAAAHPDAEIKSQGDLTTLTRCA